MKNCDSLENHHKSTGTSNLVVPVRAKYFIAFLEGFSDNRINTNYFVKLAMPENYSSFKTVNCLIQLHVYVLKVFKKFSSTQQKG